MTLAGALLPPTRDPGVAVVENRAFDHGALFARALDRPLPGSPARMGVGSWRGVRQVLARWRFGKPTMRLSSSSHSFSRADLKLVQRVSLGPACSAGCER